MAMPASHAAPPPMATLTRKNTPSECSSERSSGIEKCIIKFWSGGESESSAVAQRSAGRAAFKPALAGGSSRIEHSVPAAFEVRRLHLRPRQELASRPAQRDPSVDHDIAAVRELQRVERVLLHQEHGELLLAVELADRAEDLANDQRRQAERRLVEQQQPRPAHQRARDRQHLLLAAR